MVFTVEMQTNLTFRNIVANIIEVRWETVHESIFRLSHILDTAQFTGYTVYEIQTLA